MNPIKIVAVLCLFGMMGMGIWGIFAPLFGVSLGTTFGVVFSVLFWLFGAIGIYLGEIKVERNN